MGFFSFLFLFQNETNAELKVLLNLQEQAIMNLSNVINGMRNKTQGIFHAHTNSSSGFWVSHINKVKQL